MRCVTNVLIALLFLINPIGHSQSDNRIVAFDCPKLPTSEFNFDVDSQVIALLMEDPTSDIPPLFNTIDVLSLRSYRGQSVSFKDIVEYYQDILEARQWHVLRLPAEDDLESATLHLYVLQENDTVYGIFAMIKSTDTVYLINITGAIPEEQLGALLTGLNKLSIEIPELMSLNSESVKAARAETSMPAQTAPATRTPSVTPRETPPLTRTVSLLRSMTISAAGSSPVYESIPDTLVGQKNDLQASKNIPRFWAGDVPIHAIRIRGNQKISEQVIRQTLENSQSPDLSKALETLFKAAPYFKEIALQVDKESSKYIATITFSEKLLSTGVYLGFHRQLRLGFNRVTGWEIGATGIEFGKRENVGPFWVWNLSDSVSDRTHKLFGEANYVFGNPRFHYRLGGTANWGKLHTWSLGLTAQIHRLTDVVAPELFPNMPLPNFQRTIGAPDLQNYYLRQGAEIAMRWSPEMPLHTFKMTMLAESQSSLQKSTDWFLTNWSSTYTVRENPPIRPGKMRSIAFQYDFRDLKRRSLGWQNTLLIEHSNTRFGSDFDFTRLLLHLRYAFPLGDHRVRTRFLFGFSNRSLPVQRQFVINGIAGLRGYPWYREENEPEGFMNYKFGHTVSPYAFAGDRGFLLNVEYHHSLATLLRWSFFKTAFAIIFLDEGQVWHVSGPAYTFNPKGNIGIGAQMLVGIFLLRANIAKAFESGKGFQVTTVLNHPF